jgi:hypothetical protein
MNIGKRAAIAANSARRNPMPQRVNKPITRTAAWICAAVFALATLVAATLLDTVVLEPWLKERTAQTWAEVPCVILKSDVTTHAHTSHGNEAASYGYSPAVRYEYRVDGKAYTSDRYWFSEMLFNQRDEAEAVVADYRVGSNQTCYVDPQSPDESVLVRKGPPQTIVLLLFAGALVVAGAVLCLASLWAAIRPRRQRSPA